MEPSPVVCGETAQWVVLTATANSPITTLEWCLLHCLTLAGSGRTLAASTPEIAAFMHTLTSATNPHRSVNSGFTVSECGQDPV